MSFTERARLVMAILSSVFVRKSTVEAELRRYHQDERAALEEFAARLPTAKRILVDERDDHMAKRLRRLHEERGDVVAVVGDGHIEGLSKRLADESVEILRLKDLEGVVPPTGASATVSFQL